MNREMPIETGPNPYTPTTLNDIGDKHLVSEATIRPSRMVIFLSCFASWIVPIVGTPLGVYLAQRQMMCAGMLTGGVKVGKSV